MHEHMYSNGQQLTSCYCSALTQ